MELSVQTLKKVLCGIFYFVLLELAYFFIEVKSFSYVGFNWNFSIVKFLLGWILYAIVCIVVMAQNRTVISTVFYYVIFFLSIAPCIVLYQFDNTQLWMILYQVTMLIFMISIVNMLYCKKLSIPFKLSSTSRAGYGGEIHQYNITFILIALFFGYSLIKNGVPNFNSLGFYDVYKIRADSSFSFFDVTAQNLMCRILIPLEMAYSLRNCKWMRALVTIIVQLYIYSITGFKTYLFVIAIVIGMEILKHFPMQKKMLVAFTLVMLIGLGIYALTNNLMFAALLFNRTIFFPAKIKWAYMDFFSQNPFPYFADTTIGHFLRLKSPYGQPIVYLIGAEYFGKPEMWTNTGFLADAYANMGWLGGILISLIAAVVLKMIDFVNSYSDDKTSAIVFILYFIALNDGSLISNLVSGGLLLCIFVVGLLNNHENNTDEIRNSADP